MYVKLSLSLSPFLPMCVCVCVCVQILMWMCVDPVTREPKGIAGVETGRSRKRSRAASDLPQVSTSL